MHVSRGLSRSQMEAHAARLQLLTSGGPVCSWKGQEPTRRTEDLAHLTTFREHQLNSTPTNSIKRKGSCRARLSSNRTDNWVKHVLQNILLTVQTPCVWFPCASSSSSSSSSFSSSWGWWNMSPPCFREVFKTFTF